MTRTSDKHAIPEGEASDPDAYEAAMNGLFEGLTAFFEAALMMFELAWWVVRG